MPEPTTYGSFSDQRPSQTYAVIEPESPGHQHVASTRRMLAIVLTAGVSLILGIGYIANSVVLTSSSPHFLGTSSNNVGPSTSQLASAPTQVHVALADQERTQEAGSAIPARLGITISWASAIQTQTSSVRFGLDALSLLSIVQAETKSEQYLFCQYTSPWFHHVVIASSQLEPSTTYYCKLHIGDWSR